jgi:hypothetical protein
MADSNTQTPPTTEHELQAWDARFAGEPFGRHREWDRAKLIAWVDGIEPMLKRIWYAVEPFADEIPPGDLADNVEGLAKLLQAERAK